MQTAQIAASGKSRARETKLSLTDDEVLALEALTAYGDEEFLQWFYEHMGKDFLQPYEGGLISLFDKVRRLTR